MDVCLRECSSEIFYTNSKAYTGHNNSSYFPLCRYTTQKLISTVTVILTYSFTGYYNVNESFIMKQARLFLTDFGRFSFRCSKYKLKLVCHTSCMHFRKYVYSLLTKEDFVKLTFMYIRLKALVVRYEISCTYDSVILKFDKQIALPMHIFIWHHFSKLNYMADIFSSPVVQDIYGSFRVFRLGA